MRSPVLKGHLDLLILSVLEDRPGHGYAIVERLKRKSDRVFKFPEGTMYPALYRLEDKTWLTSRVSTVDGRARRVYRITVRGRTALRQQQGSWRRLARGMQSVLGPG